MWTSSHASHQESLQSDRFKVDETVGFKTKSGEQLFLDQAFGDLCQFCNYASTCHGSRIVQEELVLLKSQANESHRRLSQLVWILVNGGHVERLVLDKFGNYFVQTLLANICEGSFNVLIDHLTRDPDGFAEMCNHQFGSHVIQTAINHCGGNVYSSAKLTKCLSETLPTISTKFLGSICVIHGIDSLSPSLGIAPTIAIHARLLSCSRHGHTIVIHALERFDQEFMRLIEKAVLNELDDYVTNDFGSRVLFHVLSKQKHLWLNTNTSFISGLVGEIVFSAKYFQLIEYLVTNFPSNHQVKHKLIPSIVRIVRAGVIPLVNEI